MKNKAQKDSKDKPVTQAQLKEELKGELKGVHKKMDSFVTKTELKNELKGVHRRMDSFVTKTELQTEFLVWAGRLKWYFEGKINELREEMHTTMYTKKDHQKFMEYMDEAMKEMRDSNRDRILTGNQLATMDDKIANHEKRLRVLER